MFSVHIISSFQVDLCLDVSTPGRTIKEHNYKDIILKIIEMERQSTRYNMKWRSMFISKEPLFNYRLQIHMIETSRRGPHNGSHANRIQKNYNIHSSSLACWAGSHMQSTNAKADKITMFWLRKMGMQVIYLYANLLHLV